MTTHLGLQRILLPSAQVSQLTTGSITLPSAGGEFFESFDSISSTTLTTDTSSNIDFTSIPTIYTHLQLRILGKAADTATVTNGNLRIQFNNDTGANYSSHYMIGASDGSKPAGSNTGDTAMYGGKRGNLQSGRTLLYGISVIDILNYQNTNMFKTIRYYSSIHAGSNGEVFHGTANWRSTSAITSIKITMDTGNLGTNMTASLYGIRS